jgi:ribose 5-phosphate isomerase B
MSLLIYLGADHAGLALKESVKRHLAHNGIEIEDLGAHRDDPHDDYPVYAARVANAVRRNPRSLGILFCGSAEGVCIAANKFDDIRAGIGFSIPAAQSLRHDDHGNVLCLPGRLETQDNVMTIVDAFLEASPSSEQRHQRRVHKITAIEHRE